MSFYRWCMRSGAAILFVISGLQLLLGILIVIKTYGAMSGGAPSFVSDSGAPSMQILLVLQQLIGVFSAAALPFFGALLIYRLDRRHRADPREAEPFE